MAATAQSEVPMVGSVAKMVNRLSKVEDPILKMGELKKMQHVVIYEYKAQQADEIDLDVGDIVEVVKTVEDGWNRGKNLRTGASGMYPTNYCELNKSKIGLTSSGGTVSKQYTTLKKNDGAGDTVPSVSKRVSTSMESPPPIVVKEELTPSPILPSSIPAPPVKEEPEKDYAKVTFEYVAQHADELSLKVGQIVWVVKKRTTDSGWYEGEVDGKRGLFPDNFVTLLPPGSTSTTSLSSQIPPPSSSSPSTSNPPSGRVGDKPPVSLPGAIPVMPLPPQVPAKPPKTTSGSGVNGPAMATQASTTAAVKTSLGWKTPTPANQTTTNTVTVSSLTTGVSSLSLKEEEKEKEKEKEVKDAIKPPTSSFKQNQANILARLNMHNPVNGRPPGLSSSSTRIDEEGVNENGDSTVQDQPLLTHPNKTRPKGPSGVRRPVSMFPPPSTEFHAIGSKDVMTKSEMTLNETPAPIVSSHSLSPSASVVSPSISAFVPPKETFIGSSVTSTVTTTSIQPSVHSMVSESLPDSTQSQWVSRSEYNQLLVKVAILEERLCSLERR